MSYQLYDAGAGIRVSQDGSSDIYLAKHTLRKMQVVREDVIKLDTGGCQPVYIRHADVSLPVFPSAITLVDELNLWITDGICLSDQEVTPPSR